MWIVQATCLLATLLGLVLAAEECRKSNLGGDYFGTQTQTLLGLDCQRWDSQVPHDHSWTDPKAFPDDTMDEVANNCRNPDIHSYGLWCYTTDPGTRWGFCQVPLCDENYPQCKYTDEGTEYLGSLSETASGEQCQEWADEEHNYCRNPDQKEGGPWCYTDNNEAWDYCDVAFCKPSASCKRSEEGQEYVGTVSVSVNGYPCQRWDKQTPHSHDYTDEDYFPDDTLEDANNYCRNPDDARADGPWCYTQHPDVEWEYCNLPVCTDCKVTETGREYFGSVSETQPGETCQRWDSQSPHPHDLTDTDRYPDASLGDAANYCRNPDGKSGGPWCFTSNPSVEWEYCDIPDCGAQPNEPSFRSIRHVLHIGIDGLDPCFVDSPLGAPNIMNRLGAQGTYTISGAHTTLETVSVAAWMSIQCGAPMETTGADSNSWMPPWKGYPWPLTPVTGVDIPYPCVYRGLKQLDNNIRTAALYDWRWHHAITAYGDPSSVDYDLYIDPVVNGNGSWADLYIAGNASIYLKDVLVSAESSYTFVYFEHLDVQGHTNGWCGEEYLDYVDILDQFVGMVLDAVEDVGMDDEVLVILGSDHGGVLFSHGCKTDGCLDVPMFVRGPGIKQNQQFVHEVRNQDIVPTAVYAMGLTPNPWWKGTPMYEAFEDL